MKINTSEIMVLDENRIHEGETSIIESIGRIGIINPITVYVDKEGPVLVAGHRRLASAKHFGIEKVECNIVAKEKAAEIRALENIDRKNLGPMDEAIEINNLFIKGYSRNEIAAIMGTNESRIARRAKLNNLCDKAVGMLKDNKITLVVAEELATIEDKNLQETIIKNHKKFLDVNMIRHEHFLSKGLPLADTSQEFKNLKGCEGTSCQNCPNNPASDTVLFAEGNDSGSCSVIECWMNKIETLVKQKNAKGICTYRTYTNQKANQELIEQFRNKGTQVFEENKGELYFTDLEYETREIDKSILDTYISVTGNTVYDRSQVQNQTSHQKDEKTELEEEYREKQAEFGSSVTLYMQECFREYDKANPRLLERTSEDYMIVEYAFNQMSRSWGNTKNTLQRITGYESFQDVFEKNSASTLFNMVAAVLKIGDFPHYCNTGWIAQTAPIDNLPDFTELDNILGVDVYPKYRDGIQAKYDEIKSVKAKYEGLGKSA